MPKGLLDRHTAVSGEVAEAMATGGLERCPAALIAAITGVAGPDPDEDGSSRADLHRRGRLRRPQARNRREFGELEKNEICRAAMRAALTLLEELLHDRCA